MHTKFCKQAVILALCLLLVLSTGCVQQVVCAVSSGHSQSSCVLSAASSAVSSAASSAASSQPSSSGASSSGASSRSDIVSSAASSKPASSSSSEAPDTTEYRGIDVSVYQDDIDFSSVKEAGIDVVYIRAGAGTDITDAQFLSNYQKAKAAGLKLGFYYYVTASSVSQAETQAARFAALIKDKTYTVRPAMDYESYGNLTNSEINAIALAFLTKLQQLTGIRPVLYSDAYRVRTLWSDALTVYPLWIADYSTGENTPPSTGKWATWAGYQYSDAGKINGIKDDVDLDRFKQAILIA